MNKQVNLKWISIIFLLSVFILQSSLFFNQTSPLRWLAFNLFLLLVCSIISYKKHIAVFLNYPSLFLLAFICIQFCSFFYSVNNTLILPSIQNSLFLLVGIITLPLLLKKDSSFISVILKGIGVICLIWNIFGIIDFITLSQNFLLPAKNSYLVASLFGNKNIYASALLLCTPLLIIGFIKSFGNWKHFFLIVISLNIMMIVVLQTLSVWIASILIVLIVSGGSVFFINVDKNGRNKLKVLFKRFRVQFVLLPGLVIAYAIYINANTGVQAKIANTINNDTNTINSINERFFLWNKSYEMIKDNPFIGVGSGNWKTHINSYGLNGSSAANGNVNYASPHNDPILLLCENGILGFVIYFLFVASVLFYAIKNIIKSKKYIPESTLLLAGITAFYCYSLFEYPLSRPEHILILTIYISLLLTLIEIKSLININSLLQKTAIGILMLLCAFNLYMVRCEYYILKANDARFKHQWQKVILNSKKINDNYFDADATVIPVKWYEGIAWFNLQNYPEAHTCFVKAYKKYPYNLHVLNNLASTYSLQNKNDSAMILYKKAMSISNDFDEARINYCIVLFNEGKREECLKELQKIKDDSIIMTHMDFFLELIDPQNIKQIKSLEELKKNLQFIR